MSENLVGTGVDSISADAIIALDTVKAATRKPVRKKKAVVEEAPVAAVEDVSQSKQVSSVQHELAQDGERGPSVSPQDEGVHHNGAPVQSAPQASQQEELSEDLIVRVSDSLFFKLQRTAREEGLTVNELATELIAEGVTLRAWEIIERKNTMRGGNQNPQNNGNRPQNHGNQHPNNRGNNNRRGNMPHGRNNRHANHAQSLNLMEDKAAFLEYVRNQEKRRR